MDRQYRINLVYGGIVGSITATLIWFLVGVLN